MNLFTWIDGSFAKVTDTVLRNGSSILGNPGVL